MADLISAIWRCDYCTIVPLQQVEEHAGEVLQGKEFAFIYCMWCHDIVCMFISVYNLCDVRLCLLT